MQAQLYLFIVGDLDMQYITSCYLWGQFDAIQCLTSLTKMIDMLFASYFMTFPNLLGTTGKA